MICDETQEEISQRFAAVYQLYEEGFDIATIARELDMSPFAINKIIKNRNYRYKRDGEFKEIIIKACADFGLSKCFAIRLYKTLRRKGIIVVVNGEEIVRAHKMTDGQLLRFDGIGPKSVEIIRHAYEI